VHDGAIWDAITLLSGKPVGWNSTPPLQDLGAVVARYHLAALRLPPRRQRPLCFPLTDLLSRLRSKALVDPGIRQVLVGQVRELLIRLQSIPERRSRAVVIHGDFTAHNILAGGKPLRVTGVIDFALAHVEDWLADLGFGLYRTGRPNQEATFIDLHRLERFLCGYHSVRPLTPEAVEAVPLYLWARGIQRLVKQAVLGTLGAARLEQVDWTRSHEPELRDLVRDVVASRP
jgi:Ser/Thr protein kinase RdoA (MazF antagonist)